MVDYRKENCPACGILNVKKHSAVIHMKKKSISHLQAAYTTLGEWHLGYGCSFPSRDTAGSFING